MIEEFPTHDFIITVSGARINHLKPDPNIILITDIAWCLSGQCRYNNHLAIHYSNAEHSVLGSRHIDDPKLKREFLVHDFAEFVFGDIPSPIKKYCPDYKAHIHKFEGFLNNLFLGYSELSPFVKQYDLAITETERRHFMQFETDTVPLDVQIKCWDKFEAYNQLLKEFDKLFPDYKGK